MQWEVVTGSGDSVNWAVGSWGNILEYLLGPSVVQCSVSCAVESWAVSGDCLSVETANCQQWAVDGLGSILYCYSSRLVGLQWTVSYAIESGVSQQGLSVKEDY